MSILLAIASQSAAMAAQPVFFKPPQELSAPPSLMDFISSIKGFAGADVVIATSDLNNDFINEYIVKTTSCPPAAGCLYRIIADNDTGYIVIAAFSGKNISISDKQTHGIRDILVYNQKLNDYAHTTLKWDMQNMQYGFNNGQAG